MDAFPNGIVVQDLPHSSEELEDKVAIADALFKEGFLLIDDVAEQNGEHQQDSDNDPF